MRSWQNSPLLPNRRLAQLSSGEQLPGIRQIWFSQRCPGRSRKDIAHTCTQARTPCLALPRALPDPRPFQHLFHITFLVFQALWTHSILSQMFPSSTSPHGMNNPNSAEERVQMFWFWSKLWYRMRAKPCSQRHRPFCFPDQLLSAVGRGPGEAELVRGAQQAE